MPTQPLNKTREKGKMKKLWHKSLDILCNYHRVQNRLSLGAKKDFAYPATLRYSTLWNYIALQISAGIVIIFYMGWIYLAVYISGSLPSNREASFHQWWNWDQVTYLRYHKQPDTDSKRKICFAELFICMPRSQRQTRSASWLAHGLQGDVRRLMLREQIRMCSRFAFLSVQPLNQFPVWFPQLLS